MDLVEDLLLLARLDAGRELRREEVDLVGLLVDTVADALKKHPQLAKAGSSTIGYGNGTPVPMNNAYSMPDAD
ncbi:MAG: hypothetical protein ACFNKE_11050, partial [Neisseria elongata]